ncbi:hypothetical protein [Noviluteimonas gilva]|uniref:Uncharacterized protein n=1 Tax=Noviluteimonas gilva TaxID=2682097 RepID=A0A7C9HKG0_9GAMM|nr:hypothetical protein [Lysobacter gilvus]MUV12892.1 hypothetical protein [Lysobacter gilvus]
MNTNHNDPSRNAIDEREWQAQERALRDARDGVPSTDPLALRYRKVTDALRAPLPDLLPADFASQVAQRAEANARAPEIVQSARSGVLEGKLLRAAIGIFGLGSAVVVGVYGPEWIAPMAAFLHLDSAVAVNWALALGACVGATWLTDQLRRHREQAVHAA